MDGHDLLYGVPQSEIDKIIVEGQKQQYLSDNRILLTVAKDENYMDNPQVIDLLSQGYSLKKKIALAGSYQLVFENEMK